MGCCWGYPPPPPREDCSIELYNEIWRPDQLTPLLASEENVEVERTLSFEEDDPGTYSNVLLRESVIQQGLTYE
jgi:hypothetical protein